MLIYPWLIVYFVNQVTASAKIVLINPKLTHWLASVLWSDFIVRLQCTAARIQRGISSGLFSSFEVPWWSLTKWEQRHDGRQVGLVAIWNSAHMLGTLQPPKSTHERSHNAHTLPINTADHCWSRQNGKRQSRTLNKQQQLYMHGDSASTYHKN